MKKILIILFLCIGWISLGQNPDSLFKEATVLYEKQEYDQAIEKWQALSEKNPSKEVYYNLGNAYYKKRDVGNAVYYYEKALKIDSEFSKAKTNLKFAQKMRLDEFQQKKRFNSNQIIHNTIGFLSYECWAITAVLSSLAIIVFFGVYYFSTNHTVKRIFFTLMFIGVFGAVLSFVAAHLEQTYQQSERYAIVLSDQADVKAEARNTAKNVKVIHAGTKLYISEESSKWYRVTLPDLNEGWILKSEVREL